MLGAPRLLAGWLLALVLVAGTEASARTVAPHLSAAKARAISALVSRFMEQRRVPGATVAISLDGREIWARGFGLADVENRVPATPDSVYRTASIGKPMTATLAMMLVRDGRLDLEAPVQHYCPRFPEKQWPVRVRHLLTHVSGIRGPDDAGELYNTRHYDQPSDAVALFADDPLAFEPGTDFLYSTWNYVLLGCVIEGAAGEDYRSLMASRIFAPAGMTRTRDDDPRAIVPGRARGYIVEEGELRVARWTDMSHKLAAGGWVTTAGDLLRFMNAWMSGSYLPEDVRVRMLEPARLNDQATVDNYGTGWFIDDYHGLRAGLHGGGTPGVSAIAFFVPERRLALAGFFNLENLSGADRIALAEAIADVVLDQSTPNPNHFGP
jgi:serine beta-lactamase-like protein LACTB, mitochondrial